MSAGVALTCPLRPVLTFAGLSMAACLMALNLHCICVSDIFFTQRLNLTLFSTKFSLKKTSNRKSDQMAMGIVGMT
jgi:hypothetical protein